jgi:hypothetical protein
MKVCAPIVSGTGFVSPDALASEQGLSVQFSETNTYLSRLTLAFSQLMLTPSLMTTFPFGISSCCGFVIDAALEILFPVDVLLYSAG